jgi:hypothetical protein
VPEHDADDRNGTQRVEEAVTLFGWSLSGRLARSVRGGLWREAELCRCVCWGLANGDMLDASAEGRVTIVGAITG